MKKAWNVFTLLILFFLFIDKQTIVQVLVVEKNQNVRMFYLNDFTEYI